MTRDAIESEEIGGGNVVVLGQRNGMLQDDGAGRPDRADIGRRITRLAKRAPGPIRRMLWNLVAGSRGSGHRNGRNQVAIEEKVQSHGGPGAIMLEEKRESVGSLVQANTQRRRCPGRPVEEGRGQAVGVAVRAAGAKPDLIKIAIRTSRVPDEIA